MSDWIIYLVVYAVFFVCSFWSLTGIDFSKFVLVRQREKFYLLVFLLSMALAWMCTEAVMTLTLRQGY